MRTPLNGFNKHAWKKKLMRLLAIEGLILVVPPTDIEFIPTSEQLRNTAWAMISGLNYSWASEVDFCKIPREALEQLRRKSVNYLKYQKKAALKATCSPVYTGNISDTWDQLLDHQYFFKELETEDTPPAPVRSCLLLLVAPALPPAMQNTIDFGLESKVPASEIIRQLMALEREQRTAATTQ
ncbi:hypothetical protein BROUX41_004134 [Berkeleyomyces rouxiae]|uniref:uncharacterized protein n=1 Tax=Berkeleyomyces rouxiae TaxID=2035830 RepID=UPI003B7B54D1